MTSTVWVTEKYTCPECGGSGWNKRTVLEDDEHSLPIALLCTTCFGSGEAVRGVSLEETKFWRDFTAQLMADMVTLRIEQETIREEIRHEGR